MNNIFDLIIIGSGPAGLTAAVYAARAQLHTLIIEKNYMSGGQILTTYEVDNYPGLQGINGFDMGIKFREHADKLGAVFYEDIVTRIENEGKISTITTEKDVFKAKTVIIATGARHRKLMIEGEERLTGAGVSYCATCDGAFFRNKTVAVAGGGDVALEDAIFLSRICKKVYLIHRRDEFRGTKLLQNHVRDANNIEIIWNTVVTEVKGEEQVDAIITQNIQDKAEKELRVNGIFIAIGITPNSQEVKGLVNMDPNGYIIAGEDCATSVPGIFAAGDVRTKMLRQIITAASDGANAVMAAQNYLLH